MRRRQAYFQPREEVIPREAKENAETRQGRQEVLTVLATPEFVAHVPRSSSSCPKCGKTLGRGAHFHLKACKG